MNPKHVSAGLAALFMTASAVCAGIASGNPLVGFAVYCGLMSVFMMTR